MLQAFSDFPWPKEVQFYTFDEVPLARDLFVIGASQIDVLKSKWDWYLSQPDGPSPGHPNSFLKHRWCAIETRDADSCEINLEISIRTRWHGAIRTLPRTKFVGCVKFWNYEKRPYLIVDQDWFDDIEQTRFSLYGLVDVVGMRALLSRQGKVEQDQLQSLKREMDSLAAKHREFAFVTFADNVLVKTNWSARPDVYDASYNPEKFLHVLADVRKALRSVLGLDSYAVVTQGGDSFASESPLYVSPEQNHVFFGSLGTPFVELFDIDKAARLAIRSKSHAPCNLYLAHSFLLTLKFKDFEIRDVLEKQLAPFESAISVPDFRKYLPIDEEHLLSCLTPTASSDAV